MNVSLTKVSGVCAILTTASCLPWMVLPIIAPAVGIEFPQSLEWEDWARLKVDHRSVFLTGDWLVILCLIFETAAVVGFFYVLRVAGPLTWLGLAAWLTGLQLVMLEHIFVLGISVNAQWHEIPCGPGWQHPRAGCGSTRLCLSYSADTASTKLDRLARPCDCGHDVGGDWRVFS